MSLSVKGRWKLRNCISELPIYEYLRLMQNVFRITECQVQNPDQNKIRPKYWNLAWFMLNGIRLLVIWRCCQTLRQTTKLQLSLYMSEYLHICFTITIWQPCRHYTSLKSDDLLRKLFCVYHLMIYRKINQNFSYECLCIGRYRYLCSLN